MATKFEELLSKEMTRRQFLMTIGLGFVSLFGLSAMMGALTKEAAGVSQAPTGYGARTYGR